jgi:hypothetical protein
MNKGAVIHMIIAAYAGTGKTTLAAKNPDRVADFVCMPYKYYLAPNEDSGEAGKGNPNNVIQEDWPYNYTKAIMSASSKKSILLIPSEIRVLELLIQEDTHFTLCYPRRDAKDIYRQRFIARGNTKEFISIFIDGWDWFIDKLEAVKIKQRIVMNPQQFLSDVIDIASITI